MSKQGGATAGWAEQAGRRRRSKGVGSLRGGNEAAAQGTAAATQGSRCSTGKPNQAHPQRLERGGGVLEVVGRLAQHVRLPPLLHDVPVRLVCGGKRAAQRGQQNSAMPGHLAQLGTTNRGKTRAHPLCTICTARHSGNSTAATTAGAAQRGAALTAVHGHAHAAAARRDLGVAALLLQRRGGQQAPDGVRPAGSVPAP